MKMSKVESILFDHVYRKALSAQSSVLMNFARWAQVSG